ncbi:hypothetical protein [Nonomuraea sp. NPDC050310]|uniref:hypothetical protein n=1 Tax=Nonomuraea sp. NPDC050310 TaxID=3154935 RepID=UPI0033E774EF
MRRMSVSSIVSLATLAVAVLWWFVPESYPYGAASEVSVGFNHWVEREAGTALLAASGVLGLLVAPAQRSRPRLAAVGAAVQGAFFLLVMCDASVLASLGYAMIPAVVAGVVALVAIGVLRRRPVAYGAALVLVGGVVLALTLTDALPHYVAGLATGFGRFAERIAWSWAMAIAAVTWAWLAYRGLAQPEEAANPRWGRTVTILAALGGVPYAVARLSWATPWPLGGFDPRTGHVELLAQPGGDPATRLQGFMIGMSAVLAVVLTLGLISRWGEVFPRWVPRVGGRPVPVLLAVVPGAFAALALCVSAPGVLATAVQLGSWLDGVLFVLLFPCPVWGPLLGAAVLAYWRRRTTAVSVAVGAGQTSARR